MPYQTSEAPSREIQEAAIALRSQVHASAKHDWEISCSHESLKAFLRDLVERYSQVSAFLAGFFFQSAPALDVSAVLMSSVRRKRTVLTVPWLVEFLSMLDYTGPFLPCYRTALGLLLQIYRFVTCSTQCVFCFYKCRNCMYACVLGGWGWVQSESSFTWIRWCWWQCWVGFSRWDKSH